MKKINLMYLILSACFYPNCFAQLPIVHAGYLNTIDGKIVKDIYGECVHMSYFDKDTNAVAACE